MHHTTKIYTCETAVNSDSIVCDFWDSHCSNSNVEPQYYFAVTHNTPLADPIVIAIFKDEQVNSLLIDRKFGKGTNAPLTIIYGGLIGICDQNLGISHYQKPFLDTSPSSPSLYKCKQYALSTPAETYTAAPEKPPIGLPEILGIRSYCEL